MPMRFSAFAIAAAFAASSAAAMEAVTAENVLSGTRWMEVTEMEAYGTIAVERLYRVRLCTIADVAFVVREGRLVRYDRAVLSGKRDPVSYERTETAPGRDGGAEIVAFASMGNTAPDFIRIDAGGDIMRLGGDPMSAYYMKCRP